MTKVVLYNLDGALTGYDGEKRELFYPELTKATFSEHRRKEDYVIVSSSQCDADSIKALLNNAGIDTATIEIVGKNEIQRLSSLTPEGKNVSKAIEVMNRFQDRYNAVVIVDDSLRVDAGHPDVIHVLVPRAAPKAKGKPLGSSYLEVPLLPKGVLIDRIRPEIGHIKSKDAKGDRDFDFTSLNNLSKLYKSVTNLFRTPSSYEKLASSEQIVGRVGTVILRDYCKNSGDSLIWGKLGRFFTFHWNRNHVDAVQKTLKRCAAESDTKALLIALKSQLIASGNTLNPHGSLARRIEFLQKKAGIAVIDIDNLNLEIDYANKFKSQGSKAAVTV
jgi:hypothetical protein